MRKINIPDGKIKISINIPEKLLIELDICRKETKQDRSSWVTGAIMEKLVTTKKELNYKNLTPIYTN